METVLEHIKKEELPRQYQTYFEKKGGGALYVPLNESSAFSLLGGGLLMIFFSLIIYSTADHIYQYPTYENFLWLAFYSFMVLLGIRVFYKALKKKSLVDSFNWPYGLYFDNEAMLIATESHFTLVPRQFVYLHQKKDRSLDRYKGTIVYEIRYQGVWDFGIDMGRLSDVAIQKFNHWVATGNDLRFY
jgi:hypothetical protein